MEDNLKSILKRLKENESMISMGLGALVMVIVGALLFNYMRDSKTSEPQILESAESTQSAELQGAEYIASTNEPVTLNLPLSHTVVKGEHLWMLAEKFYGSGYNLVDIAKENKLGVNARLEIGQVLTIPKAEVRLAKGQQVKTKTAEIRQETVVTDGKYTVKKGDSLWKIAVAEYQDGFLWVKIYEANKEIIKNTSYIEIGWQLTIPR